MLDINIQLPNDFLREEERCDYIISSDMKKVWAVELDLLQKLLEVCKKYDIKIFANGGTMLGAIRHKGIIPWDDDIDMMMFRKDYDRLCSVAEKEFKEPYFFQTEYNDPGMLRGHAQLRNSNTTAILKAESEYGYKFNQGIFIDIFPLDSVIDDDKLFIEQYHEAMKYRKWAGRFANLSSRYYPRNGEGIKGKVINFLYPIANAVITKYKLVEKEYSKFEEVCQRYNHVKTEKISTLCLEFNNHQHFKYRKDFKDIIYVPFEFMEIPIGSEYEHALTNRFGNYNEFIKGGSVHGEIIFDAEIPYKTYISEMKKNDKLFKEV